MIDILKRIFELREKRGWSECELARIADMSQSTISSWYRDNSLPTLSSLEKICKAFEISFVKLFEEGSFQEIDFEMETMIESWNKLSGIQREHLLKFLKSIV